MKTNFKRRDFIKYTACFCTAFVFGCKLNTNSNNNSVAESKKYKGYDLKEMSYCCGNCDESCELFKATKYDDLNAKKRLAELISKRLNKTFPIEDVFCYGCKNEDKPINTRTMQCTVRKCAKEKRLISCALCNDLPDCDKELWKKWPNSKVRILNIQKEMKS